MIKRKPLPPFDELRRLFDYDPATGIVRWKARSPHSKVSVGTEANSRLQRGYLRVMIAKEAYRLHAIIWKWMTGFDPKEEIDHIDLNKANNRWSNLREATRAQNGANLPITSRNTTGFKGVSIYRPSNKFRASVRKNGRLYFLGDFDTPQEAHKAYLKKAAELFGAYAREK